MTREAWLLQATDQLRSGLFKRNGETVPPVKVSVGWPGGGGNNRKAIGQHWHPRAAADGMSQVFISPVLVDPVPVLETLVHELVHAIVPDAGHKKPFKRIALAVGLTGKMTATVAGPVLAAELQGLAETLGPYPHARLNLSDRKKQTTRLLKAVCGMGCGGDKPYNVRITRGQADEVGLPICPGCETQMGLDGEPTTAKPERKFTEADIPF